MDGSDDPIGAYLKRFPEQYEKPSHLFLVPNHPMLRILKYSSFFRMGDPPGLREACAKALKTGQPISDWEPFNVFKDRETK